VAKPFGQLFGGETHATFPFYTGLLAALAKAGIRR